MKGIAFVLIIFLSIAGPPAYPKKLASLPEVSKPYVMVVNNGQLIISDLTVKVHLYSLKDFRYLKQVTRKGEGPGECLNIPRFWVGSDYIFLYYIGKCMFFSRDGEFKKQFRIPYKGISFIAPIEKNYVVQRKGENPKRNMYSHDLSIESYSQEKGLQYKKLIYYYEYTPRKRKGDRYALTTPNEYFDFIIYDEKVFAADTTRGLFVEIYDSNGNRTGQIKLDAERTKVTEEYKKNVMEKLKKSSYWYMFKSSYYLVFAEYFPSFYRAAVDNGKVYFLTYKKKDNKREVVVADWKGNLVKRTYVPWVENEAHTNFSTENGKFYYITDNEDTGEWELHMEEIK